VHPARVNNLVPIGRFSRVCRLSVKALRHYDELGLLRPALVDAASGYRYYSLAQAADAERIRLLRELEVPLESIRVWLTDPDPASRRERLARHRALIDAKVDAHRRALAALDRLLAGGGGPRYEVAVRPVEAQRVLGIRERIPFDRIGNEAGRAFAEIYDHLATVGQRPAGPPFALYPDSWGEDEEIDVHWFVPVERPLSGAGRASGLDLPGVTAASTLHAGPYEEIGAAYAALQAFVQERGHEGAGPPREVYLVGPAQTSDPGTYRTEVLWPIR
jgi:effector-binding domain-containing protein